MRAIVCPRIDKDSKHDIICIIEITLIQYSMLLLVRSIAAVYLMMVST